MPLQNRVTPCGELIATPAKGLFMGNRGILHNAAGELTHRRWTHKSWVTCSLNYKGYQRTPRARKPHEYTELFFLDEATALAAGHRPCGLCRRKDYVRFVACWISGNEQPAATTIKQIDVQLHRERTVEHHCSALLDELPDGVFVTFADDQDVAWLVWNGELLRWAPAGYTGRREKPSGATAILLTPVSIVNTIAAGFTPQVHPDR